MSIGRVRRNVRSANEDQRRGACALLHGRTGIIANMPGCLPLEVQELAGRRSRGRSGINIDYVVNTVRQLRECGIFDRRLEALMTGSDGIGSWSAFGRPTFKLM